MIVRNLFSVIAIRPAVARIDEHSDFASQSFGTPVEAYLAPGLLNDFSHYAGSRRAPFMTFPSLPVQVPAR
jgi:hypothetical protein